VRPARSRFDLQHNRCRRVPPLGLRAVPGGRQAGAQPRRQWRPRADDRGM